MGHSMTVCQKRPSLNGRRWRRRAVRPACVGGHPLRVGTGELPQPVESATQGSCLPGCGQGLSPVECGLRNAAWLAVWQPSNFLVAVQTWGDSTHPEKRPKHGKVEIVRRNTGSGAHLSQWPYLPQAATVRTGTSTIASGSVASDTASRHEDPSNRKRTR